MCHGVIEREKFTTATGYVAWGCSVVKGGKCYAARIDVSGGRRHELALTIRQWRVATFTIK